jgi:CRP-like cAMP-binding protein
MNMTTTKFSISRDLYEELSLTESKLKSTLDYFEKKNMTSQERLFFKLWSEDQLKLGVFEKDQVIIKKGEIPGLAFAVTLGEIHTSDSKNDYVLGPGSVIGLAEGLSETPSNYEYRAKEFVNCKIIPLTRAMREMQLTNTGLKGICRMTIERILGSKTTIPDYMK